MYYVCMYCCVCEVDADGSEEGWGVVGVANDRGVGEENVPTTPSSEKLTDTTSDIRLLEEV